MRKLMWLTLGFTAATALGIYLVTDTWFLLLAACCAVACVPLALMKHGVTRRAAMALAGATVAFAWLWGFDALYLGPARAYDGDTVVLELEAAAYSEAAAFGTVTDCRVTLDGKPYKLRLYTDETVLLAPGELVTAEVYLQYTVGSGRESMDYLGGEGIFLKGNARKIHAVRSAEKLAVRHWGAVLRQKLLSAIMLAFPEDTFAFAQALLLGDTKALSYAQDTAFKVSGIRHVVAVSGLHVSILFSAAYSLAGKRRFMTAILGLPLLLFFASAAGFTPSITRACVMQAMMILALALDREYDPPTALAFAVLCILAVNPMTITSVSFQLSVGCMVGIFLFSGRISGWLLHEKRLGTGKGKSLRARLARWTAGSVSVTLSAMTVTTPLCAAYFGMVSLIGVITNLLTLWVISFVFCGILAACVSVAVWLPVGQVIGWIVAWPIRFVLVVSELLSSVPLAAVYTSDGYVVLWLLLCYVLLAVFLAVKEKKPLLLVGCMVAGLVLSTGATRMECAAEDYRFTVLDVGQGQCLLLQAGDDTYMIDCGGDYDRAVADAAASGLLSMGIRRLDGLILTHYDTDHAGAAQLLLSRIPADRLYLPDIADDTKIRDHLTQAHSDRIAWITEDTQITADYGSICLYTGENQTSGNESGLCVLFQSEKCDILITGDRNMAAESHLLSRTQLPQVDILVAGHHGAGDSTGLPLLYTVRPTVAVISVGEDNRYGHPNTQTLARLALFGCKVLRTDLHGTIIFRG